MKKPIIAITLDYCEDSPELKYSPRPWYALRCDYSAMVARHGGLPILISYEHYLIDDILALADGIMIPGGDLDIDPKFYGQKITSPKVRPNQVRAKYEIELVKRSIKAKIPLLGICNGVQIMNVALGGTLIQDIPGCGKYIDHIPSFPRTKPSHPIEIVKGTKLESIANGKRDWVVNSSHHQALDQIGDGLIVSAKAPDGVVEAIEVVGHPFAIGVEWHPEYQDPELDVNLFKAFIKATATRSS